MQDMSTHARKNDLIWLIYTLQSLHTHIEQRGLLAHYTHKQDINIHAGHEHTCTQK